MKPDAHIARLLDRYMDGETTEVEEQTLRKYFANAANDIPDEWVSYRAMFAYVVEERSKALPFTTEKPKRALRLWLFAASVAASVAVIVAVALNMNANPVAYVVIDGKVYENKELVREEALEALQMVSTNEDDTFSALDMMQP